MSPRNLRFGLVFGVAIGSSLFLSFALAAQENSVSPQTASSAVTPRTADGKPDLSGMWGGGGGAAGLGGNGNVGGDITATVASRRCAPNQAGCSDYTNETVDGEFTGRLESNRPLYKPEYWDKVQDLDYNSNSKDPVFQCQPYGVPRMGAPTKILQRENEIIFLYPAGGVGTQPEDFRIIPTDGRPHDPVRALDVTYYGDSVGHWEGDTLVVDSVGFNDITWLEKGGYFHSDLMHVVEKLRRDGNTLTYRVTVDDPQVLLQPWVMTPKILKLNVNPKATIHEGDPCRDYDYANMSTKIRH